MTTKKLLCAAVVLTTVLTGCSNAPVKTEKKDKTEEVSKKKAKDLSLIHISEPTRPY